MRAEQPCYPWQVNHLFSTESQLRMPMMLPVYAVSLPVQFHFRRRSKYVRDTSHPGFHEHRKKYLADTCSRKRCVCVLG